MHEHLSTSGDSSDPGLWHRDLPSTAAEPSGSLVDSTIDGSSDESNLLVVLEGGDGVGKSTLGQRVGSQTGWWCQENPVPPFDRVKSEVLTTVAPWSRFLFFLAANLHSSDVVRTQGRGARVVLVRYWYSTVVYQSAVAESSVSEFLRAARPLVDGKALQPSRIVFLVAEPEVQLERISRRSGVQFPKAQLDSLLRFNEDINRRFLELFTALGLEFDVVDTSREGWMDRQLPLLGQ